MKCFHLPIRKGQEDVVNHISADLVERLIPDNGGTIVCMASGDSFKTIISVETVLKRIANANAVHTKNGG